jgi:hypothetical protein
MIVKIDKTHGTPYLLSIFMRALPRWTHLIIVTTQSCGAIGRCYYYYLPILQEADLSLSLGPPVFVRYEKGGVGAAWPFPDLILKTCG